MGWFRSHPYIASVIGAVILFILGAFVVAQKSGVQPERAPRAWGGVGANLSNPIPISRDSNQAGANQENLYTNVRSGAPFYYGPTAQTPTTQTSGADDFNFGEFLAMLAPPAGGSSNNTEVANDDSLLESAYSFIPRGLLSTSSPTKERTPLQQKLYNYGNEAGSSIQTFEEIHRNSPQVLKDQFEDRESPAKNGALLALASGLAGVGYALEGMEDVPQEILQAHRGVAESYKEMGAKLSKIPTAKREQEILDAMLAYNATVENYTKNFVALATLFSAYGVTFSSEDPGSVFTFTQASF